MSRPIRFIDTSVLCSLLAIPDKDQDQDQVRSDFVEHRRHADFVLPVTAIIETGNHIAQIKDGGRRRECAEKFAEIIQMIVDRTAPWTLNSVEWDEAYLRSLLAGAGTGTRLVDLAIAKLGCGDLSILAEIDRYRARTADVEILLWTLDSQLNAYAGISG